MIARHSQKARDEKIICDVNIMQNRESFIRLILVRQKNRSRSDFSTDEIRRMKTKKLNVHMETL